MELYLKQHVTNERVLQKYADLTQKVVALQKKNNKAILAKVFPTSKACVKFTMQSMMELEMDSIPPLVNVIQQANGYFNWSEHVLIVISTYRNYKNDEMRLVLRSSEFGTGELVLQRKIQVVPDEDLTFDDDGEETPVVVAAVSEEETVSWEDEWGSFSFKKNDSLTEIAIQLSRFHHDVCGNAGGKKRKAPTATNKSTSTTVTSKKKKNEEQCESGEKKKNEQCVIPINMLAAAELIYFCSIDKSLSVEDCICRYNDEMNGGLNAGAKVDFVSLINTEGFEEIRRMVEQLR